MTQKQYEVIGGESSPCGDRPIFATEDEANEHRDFLAEMYPDCNWEVVEVEI